MSISQISDKIKYFLINTVPEAGELIKNFFSSNFETSYTKRSKIIGALVSAILTLIVILDHKAYTSLETRAKWILLGFCLVFPSVIGALITYTIKIKNNIINKIWHFTFFLLMPIVTISMTECLNNIFIYDMTYLGFFANYITLILFYFLFFALTGSFRVAILTVNPIFFGLALAHCYIVEFRGTPFIPMDFLSITTAAGVANTYNYKLMHTVLTGILLFIFIIVIGIKTNTPKLNVVEKVISRTFMGTFFAIVVSLFYFTSVFADAGVKPDFWNQTRGYKNYGFVFNFMCNTKYLYMSEPSGYNPDDVGNFVENTVDKNENNIVLTENAPNIICIMNESLSDLSVLGEFTTNEDYMPFMHSLTENTVKGNLYVPVIGAGTSNTEFEFLTGHSTAFLPSGSNAYMLYIKNPIASLVSTLEGQGYSSYTLHPYYAKGWNRVSVYENLGFNKFVSLENIMDISLMNEYIQNGNNADYLQMLVEQTYPDRDKMLVRQYISDHYNYKLLIEDFENRDKNIPYFSFNVTMQNHGGYTSGASNFNESISITSSDVYYNKASKYLSLVKESDNAFKELIEYFSNVKEPTVICMFGDHQPSIETQFIASLLGVNNLSGLTIEQEQQRHATPFFIWANYDIEEKYIEKLSANYLSSYVLDIAGVRLTDYNKYLLKLSETLPVIDTVGYIDNNNTYFRWSDNSEYKGILSEYEKIQYNNIFDTVNKDNDIFYLEGYVPTASILEEKQ